MTNEIEPESHASLAQRKEKLVREGVSYRSAISDAQGVIKDSLRAESLARSAIAHITTAAYAAFKSGAGLKGANLQTLVPLLVGGVSALSKKALLKPIVRGALILGALGTILTFVVKKKKARYGNTQNGKAGQPN